MFSKKVTVAVCGYCWYRALGFAHQLSNICSEMPLSVPLALFMVLVLMVSKHFKLKALLLANKQISFNI